MPTIGSHERWGGPGDEYVDLPTEELGNEGGILLWRLRRPMLDDDVLSLDVPVVTQTLPHRLRVIVSRSVGECLEDPDTPQSSCLLRLHDGRSGEEAKKEEDDAAKPQSVHAHPRERSTGASA
jgi:hypothetical protein